MKRLSFFLGFALLVLFSCSKDEEPPTIQYKFDDVKASPEFTSCVITCSNKSVDDEQVHARLLLSEAEDLKDATTHPIRVDGDTLRCSLAGLSEGTSYYYGFEIFTDNETYRVKDTYSFKTWEGIGVKVTTFEVTNITGTTATGGGNITIDGKPEIIERGLCWSTNHNPNHVQDSYAVADGTGGGWFTVNLTGLAPETKYYVKAYVRLDNCTVYGDEVSFTTMDANAPTVTTLEVSNITRTSALASGNVTDDGGLEITERGVCWSTAHAPNIEGSHAHNGTGAGAFSVEIGELTPNTTYYVRAYAQNSKGIAYGEEVEFRTAQDVSSPIVTTLEVSEITSTTAKGGGNVTSDGGATVTGRGICWSTEHNPTVDDAHATNGTGTGEYNVVMTDLTPGTTYYVRAFAENSQGISYGVEVSFSTVANLPTVTTGEVSNITQTTALGSGTVTDDGGVEVTERGVCWSTSHNPTLNHSHANIGIGMGGFTVEMTGLTSNTTYYVRAYAINSQGTAYGDEVEFRTSQNVSAPTVTTAQVTNITQTTATGGGNVTNDGGATVTERGICWSTEHNPTMSHSHANNGTGTGEFTCSLRNLTAGTTYYVRAYAKNSVGISYGAEVSFATEQAVTLPTVTTAQVTNITQTTATGGGNVTATGNATVTERGICWGTGHNPTISGSHASNGGGTGSYSVNMSGLTPNTTYYVRAYATNSEGTAYGAEVSFTTLQNVSLPTVTTSQVTNITQTTATGGGNVTSAGGANVTERGICWSTSHNPTTSHTHANSGTGTGTFTINMTNLTANTTYYVRAYATNSAGTAYGAEVSFTTSPSSTYTISVSASPTNGGTVSGGGTYQQGQSCTVTATANTGYTFLRWTENGNQVSTNVSYTFTVNSNRTLVAQFQQQSYTISVSANPSSGGTVSGGGTYNYGQSCTVLATANSGYTFTNWTENGNVVSTNTNYNFTVNGNRSLVANFTYNGGGGNHEYVYLGLPSGLLWATCNVGATTPEGYGNYFAWGETQPKDYYDWSNYQYCMGGAFMLTKYCDNASHGYNGFTDNLTVLEASDDAATANWGSGWRMPTNEEWQELCQYTTKIWTTQNGVNGILFTATNGNSLFLPAAGCRSGSSLYTAGSRGRYWSSSLRAGDPNYAWHLHFSSDDCGMVNFYRRTGCSVRPVCSTSVNNTISVSASPNNGGTVSGGGTYQQGQSCTVSATAATGFTFIRWTENGNQVSTNANYTFSVNGNRTLVANFTYNGGGGNVPLGAINGLFSVSASQQVYFSQGNLKYIGSASTPYWKFADSQWDHLGDNGGSTNQNVDRNLFGWGTSGYNHGAVCYQPWNTSTTNSDYYAYGGATYNLYDQTGKADWGYNAISNGGNQTNQWRTLTAAEWEYVFNTRSTASGIRYAKAKVNNVNGVILLPDDWSASYYTLSNTNTSSASYSSNTITANQWSTLEQHGAVFLPAAGYRSGTSVYHVGSDGYYWSASYYNSDGAYVVYFDDSHLYPRSSYSRYYGPSVRLVQDYNR